MPIEYVNRQGERYYLLQGKTKTGKPKYYVSRKPGAIPVDEMPEGYELHENPERGLVSVRKIRSSQILAAELELLNRLTGQLAGIDSFYVDLQGDSLVVYSPDRGPGDADRLLDRLVGGFPGARAAARELLRKNMNYHPMFRFTLVDLAKRRYTAERWCFRGS